MLLEKITMKRLSIYFFFYVYLCASVAQHDRNNFRCGNNTPLRKKGRTNALIEDYMKREEK